MVVLLFINFFLFKVNRLVTLMTLKLLISCQKLVVLGILLQELTIVFGLFFFSAPQSEFLFEERGEAREGRKGLVDRMVPQRVDVLKQLVAKVNLKN